MAERVIRDSASYTAVSCVANVLSLIPEDRQGQRREYYMRIVTLDYTPAFHHPHALGPANLSRPGAGLIRGTSNLMCHPRDQSFARDALSPDLWRCNLCRICRVMRSHMPAVSLGKQPIATRGQVECVVRHIDYLTRKDWEGGGKQSDWADCPPRAAAGLVCISHGICEGMLSRVGGERILPGQRRPGRE